VTLSQTAEGRYRAQIQEINALVQRNTPPFD
jgi:hypothetical protein